MATKKKTTARKPARKAPAKRSSSRKTAPRAKVTSTGRVFSYLSYLFVFVLFSFLFSPRDKFTRFNVRQGLVLFILEALTIMVSPFLGPLAVVAWAAWVVLSVMGIMAVQKGEMKPLPFISKYAKDL